MNKKRGETPALSPLPSPRRAFNSRPQAFFAVAVLCALGFYVIAPPAAAAVGRATQEPARPSSGKAIPAGEVTVSLNEQLFNALLEAMFALPNPPTFPLARGNSSAGGGRNCASEISLAREMNGTRTAVRFQAGRIVAPIAFSGSYSAPLIGCLKFEGWADTNLNLSFDGSKQALTARVEVKAVHLKKVPALFGDGITGLVQDTLDARFNPVEILRAEQLSARLPMTKTGSGGTLRLRAREVRHEVLANELRLRILYEFVREE
jgi:hypothetical protein